MAVFEEDSTKTLAEKTKADILSDLCCLRNGDSIFFYELNVGFHGIYEVKGIPFIEHSTIHGLSGEILENAPYRCEIRPKYYFKNPVPEQRVFGFKDSAQKIRSLFYKKALQRGKANTHLFPEEADFLTDLLMKANDSTDELTISPVPHQKNNIFFDLQTAANGELKYEKILEGWLMQNLDNPAVNTEIFLGKLSDIECFANYVPVNIAGGNIDILVFHKTNVLGKNYRYKISLIELKKSGINEDSVKQIETYVKWASENIANNDIEMLQPVLIGKKIDDSAKMRCKHYSLGTRKPILITYEVNSQNYHLTFKRINC